MRCYICDKSFGEEAGWYVCAQCQHKYPNLCEALISGEIISYRDERGALLFKLKQQLVLDLQRY